MAARKTVYAIWTIIACVLLRAELPPGATPTHDAVHQRQGLRSAVAHLWNQPTFNPSAETAAGMTRKGSCHGRKLGIESR